VWATAPSTERPLFDLYKPPSVLSSGGNGWQKRRLLDISTSTVAPPKCDALAVVGRPWKLMQIALPLTGVHC
jgi:hypothetical protein